MEGRLFLSFVLVFMSVLIPTCIYHIDMRSLSPVSDVNLPTDLSMMHNMHLCNIIALTTPV